MDTQCPERWKPSCVFTGTFTGCVCLFTHQTQHRQVKCCLRVLSVHLHSPPKNNNVGDPSRRSSISRAPGIPYLRVHVKQGGRSARVLTPPLELPQSALVTLNYTTRVPVAGFLHLLWCSERSAWIRIPQHSGKLSRV